MTYTIVFKDGSVKRHILINKVQMSDGWISFSKTDSFRSYTYPISKIASVVFYP